MSRTPRKKNCPVHAFQKLISGKHKIRIVWNLSEGPLRYNELRRGLLSGAEGTEEVAARVLSRELKQLCEYGLLRRHDYKTVPPKVEYSLTASGQSFLPVIRAMHDWGVKHL